MIFGNVILLLQGKWFIVIENSTMQASGIVIFFAEFWVVISQ
jgi:hypothetical protein